MRRSTASNYGHRAPRTWAERLASEREREKGLVVGMIYWNTARGRETWDGVGFWQIDVNNNTPPTHSIKITNK